MKLIEQVKKSVLKVINDISPVDLPLYFQTSVIT